MEQLAQWKGRLSRWSCTSATAFNQFLFNLADAAMHDELGNDFFETLLSTRVIDAALPPGGQPGLALVGQPQHASARKPAPTPSGCLAGQHRPPQEALGADFAQWQWGKAHTLTHGRPLGQQKPLDRLFNNVGPFAAPRQPRSTRTTSGPGSARHLGRSPTAPSTRRLIDFADPTHSLTINPVGQSGVLFDSHYEDQAEAYIEGGYHQAHLNDEEVTANTRSTLKLLPARGAQ